MTSISWDSVYCMCGAAWHILRLMMQLTNGQHACVLVFVPEADILNILCDYQSVFSVLDELKFHTMLGAAGDVLRVHYKSMKCNASFSQGPVSTIFRHGRRQDFDIREAAGGQRAGTGNNSNSNKAVVDSRLRPWCTTHNMYLLEHRATASQHAQVRTFGEVWPCCFMICEQT